MYSIYILELQGFCLVIGDWSVRSRHLAYRRLDVNAPSAPQDVDGLRLAIGNLVTLASRM